MGALSFKKRFVKPVKAGLQRKKGGKRQSIRNFRKRPLKVGEKLYLYYAMRTKQCTKLGESVIKSRQVIRITENRILIDDEDKRHGKILITKSSLNDFARADGFKDFEDMKAFWIAEHGNDALPYTGHLYKW